MDKEIISLSRAELKKAFVIDRLIHHQLTTAQAAQVLGLSTRQVLRLKAKVQQERSLAHHLCRRDMRMVTPAQTLSYHSTVYRLEATTSHSLPARITVQVRQTMLVVYQLCVFPTEGGEL